MSEGGVDTDERLPVVTDPKVFIDGFYNSDLFKKAYADFYKDKKLAPDVTEEERRNAFLDTDKGKYPFLDYGERQVHFSYDSSMFPEASARAISGYIDAVQRLIKAEREGDDAIISDAGSFRDFCHVKASRELKADRVVPTEKMGRALARLALIDRKLDTFSNARLNDAQRIKSMMGIAA